jgi:hypothetical protein
LKQLDPDAEIERPWTLRVGQHLGCHARHVCLKCQEMAQSFGSCFTTVEETTTWPGAASLPLNAHVRVFEKHGYGRLRSMVRNQVAALRKISGLVSTLEVMVLLIRNPRASGCTLMAGPAMQDLSCVLVSRLAG